MIYEAKTTCFIQDHAQTGKKTKSLSAILWVVISKSVWLGKDTEAFILK
jgi:hypothetical protein